MKYINAAEILPEKLLRELQTYADGELLYIPKASAKKEWVLPAVLSYFIKSATRHFGNFFRRAVLWICWQNSMVWRIVR